MTWANQVRILKQNFQQLAAIIGGTLVNALKPLIKAFNSAMTYVIAFAETISNALGKIFGWTFQKGGTGVTQDFESASGYADDLADSTGAAADNVKKMKAGLRAFDELKTISMPDTSASGGSGGAGGGLGTGTALGGDWQKGETLWEKYESEIDNLYELGKYIQDALNKSMESINWNAVYEKARNFGTGLADFLNGLISPRLFGNIAKTIAGGLNTIITAFRAFGEQFDFENFGLSIATSINEFFATFNFKDFARTLNVWVQGLWKSLKTALENVKWDDAWDKVKEFFSELELETVAIIIGAITIKKILGFHLGSKIIGWIGGIISQKIASVIASKLGVEIVKGAGIGTALKAMFAKILSSFTATISGFGIVVKVVFQKLVSSIPSIFVNLTSVISGIFKVIGSKIGGILNSAFLKNTALLGDWMSGLTATFAGVASFVGGIIVAVTSFIAMLKDGFSWIGQILMTVGTVIATVGAIILGAPAALAAAIGAAAVGIMSAIVQIKDNWEMLTEVFTLDNWIKGVKVNFEQLTSALDSVKIMFGTVVDNWKLGWEIIKSDTISAWNDTRDNWMYGWGIIVDWWNNNAISKWWSESVAPWFTKEKWSNAMSGVGEAFKSVWNGAVSTIKEIWNRFATWLNSKLKLKIDPISFGGKQIFAGTTVSLGKISAFQNGGFPESASLFFAGENGIPEIVGSVGGRTAVASGTEITGIADAVYSTGQTEASLLQTAVGLLEVIAEKEYGISSDAVFKSVRNSAKNYSRRTGRLAFDF